jgi:hypothetical protein
MEILTTVLGWFGSLPEWFAAISAILTAATGIVILTPTPADDNALAWLRKIFSFLSGNVGNNK